MQGKLRCRLRSEADRLLCGLGIAVGLVIYPAWSASAGGETTLFRGVPTASEVLDALGVPSSRPVLKMRGAPSEPALKTRAVVFANGEVVSGSPQPQPQPRATEEPQTHASAPSDEPPSSGAVAARRKPPRVQAPTATAKAVAFPLTFAINSADLTAEARRYVDSIGEAMRAKPDLTLQISGHTDARGADAVNLPLSLRRAQAVHRYLIETHRIDGARMAVSGEGAGRPLDAKNPYADENRRVEFVRSSAESKG